MNLPAPRLACIVFARIRDYARLPVAQQAEQNGRLHALIEQALARLPADGYLVLDVPGGAAIVLPDDPRAALEIAERLQVAAPRLALCIGLNHGPVKLAGADDAPELIGDGLLAAETTAGFATPERFLAARAFRDALEESDPEAAGRLIPAGRFTDAQVRSHELYAIDARAAAARRLKVRAGAAIAVLAILSLGLGARLLLSGPPKPEPPAVIVLDITPRGDISIDGLSKGSTPPLTEIEVKAGHHQISIRNGTLAPLETEVDLMPGERITLTHKFNQPEPPRQAQRQQRKPGFWRDLRNKMGIK